MPSHHPTPEILADYVSGGLRLSHALCIATHLEYCSACRQQVSKLERVGAHFFEQSSAESSAVDDLDVMKQKVFAEIDQRTGNDMEAPGIQPVNSLPTGQSGFDGAYKVPKSLRQFARDGYDRLDWGRVSPAIKIATLCRDRDGSQVSVSCVRPGGKMPHHSHTGDEITVVLEGSFSDEDGIYRKGDFILRDSRDKHKPTVTKDAECICLMVLDGPIQFTGWFTRWLNPLLRWQHVAG